MADRVPNDAEDHKKLLDTALKAVSAATSASMPAAEEYYVSLMYVQMHAWKPFQPTHLFLVSQYYTHSSSGFREQTSGFLEKIQSILTQCIPENGEVPPSSITSGDLEEVLDWATRTLLDAAMENIDDSLAIAKAPPSIADVERPSLTVGGGGSNAEAAIVKGTASGKRAKQSYVSYMQSTMKEKPQRHFKDAVDNSNIPFIHNAENLKGIVEPNPGPLDPTSHPLKQCLDNLEYPSFVVTVPEKAQEYRSFEDTPFQFVESLDELKAVAKRISESKEIAVDLEAHNYRSFQGFCCLMQLSTRTEDIIIDVLTLREHVGKILAPIFANPNIIKVLHGSDGDIVWLQRDFGIYTCNLFDTGQAVRILNYPGHGLAYLLQKHCSFKADKRWQLADWRIRPLSDEAIHYARADTHFLLYCYDVLRKELVECSTVPEHLAIPLPKNGPQGALGTALERSKQICLQLYEKELNNESSFMNLYSKSASELFSDQQLSVFAALYDWRDKVAREEDESLGYVLSRNQLLNISKALPTSEVALSIAAGKSAQIVHRKASQVLSIIRRAMYDTKRAVSVRKAWIENGNTELRKPASAVNGLTADMYTAAVSAGAIVSNPPSSTETTSEISSPKVMVLRPKSISFSQKRFGHGSMASAFTTPSPSCQTAKQPLNESQELLEKIKTSLAVPVGYTEKGVESNGGNEPLREEAQEAEGKTSAAAVVRDVVLQLQAENQREEGELHGGGSEPGSTDLVDDYIPLSISEKYGLKVRAGSRRQKQACHIKRNTDDGSRSKANKRFKTDAEGDADYALAVDKYKDLLSPDGGNPIANSNKKQPRSRGKVGPNAGKGQKREQTQTKWTDPFAESGTLPNGGAFPSVGTKRSSVMIRQGNKSMVFK
jgi:exosome complex exonuclease RRP6